MRNSLCLCLTFLFSIALVAQETPHKLRIQLLDTDRQEPLPFASIVFPNGKGTVSNEGGYFAIDLEQHQLSDTIDIQYVGYKSIQKTVAQLRKDSLLFMKEEIVNLSEIIVFSEIPDVVDVVEQILENFEKNYPILSSKKEVFVRKRYSNKIQDFELDYKKSSVKAIDEALLEKLTQNIPQKSYSYSDFLGYWYSNEAYEEMEAYKLDPTRVVALQEENLTELKKVFDVFDLTFKQTDSTEYWKVKSGIISQKMELDTSSSTANDTLLSWSNHYFKRDLYNHLEYVHFEEQDFEWQFLHKPKLYDFTLAGGTTINGEQVCIIDFKAKEKGVFEGRIYVAMESYAILRADYQYAPNKKGSSFKLFGISLKENDYEVNMHFERIDSVYALKYMSKKSEQRFTFDRKISLVKKKNRKIRDKKVEEVKVGLLLSIQADESFEFLVLDRKPLSQASFKAYTPAKKMPVIPVSQFDASLWKGHSIIEPTQMMRDYQKMD